MVKLKYVSLLILLSLIVTSSCRNITEALKVGDPESFAKSMLQGGQFVLIILI